jgi:hypothetical protein
MYKQQKLGHHDDKVVRTIWAEFEPVIWPSVHTVLARDLSVRWERVLVAVPLMYVTPATSMSAGPLIVPPVHSSRSTASDESPRSVPVRRKGQSVDYTHSKKSEGNVCVMKRPKKLWLGAISTQKNGRTSCHSQNVDGSCGFGSKFKNAACHAEGTGHGDWPRPCRGTCVGVGAV